MSPLTDTNQLESEYSIIAALGADQIFRTLEQRAPALEAGDRLRRDNVA